MGLADGARIQNNRDKSPKGAYPISEIRELALKSLQQSKQCTLLLIGLLHPGHYPEPVAAPYFLDITFTVTTTQQFPCNVLQL